MCSSSSRSVPYFLTFFLAVSTSETVRTSGVQTTQRQSGAKGFLSISDRINYTRSAPPPQTRMSRMIPKIIFFFIRLTIVNLLSQLLNVGRVQYQFPDDDDALDDAEASLSFIMC